MPRIPAMHREDLPAAGPLLEQVERVTTLEAAPATFGASHLEATGWAAGTHVPEGKDTA